jgi:hypothetical protein
MAHSGHGNCADECPLLKADIAQTAENAASDPKRTFAVKIAVTHKTAPNRFQCASLNRHDALS